MKKPYIISIYIFLLVLTVFLIPLISSAPQQSIIITDRGVDIVHPETIYHKQGNDLEFNFWTYNSSDGATLTNTSLNCTAHIINSSGFNFYRLSNQADANGLITYGKGSPLCVDCWTAIIPAENLTSQLYSYQIKCQGTDISGYATGFFEVNPTGKDFSVSISIFECLFLFYILFLFIITATKIFHSNSKIEVILFCCISYFLLLILSYLSWKLSENYLFNMEWIINFFYITFMIVLICMFPLIIGIVIYLFFSIFNEKRIKELTDMGYSPEEAKKYK